MTDRPIGRAGFTLLEVVLAMAILALAVVFLLAIRNEAIETAADALEIRRLQMLARWKIDEVLSGDETGVSGGFDDDELEGDYDGYRWSLARRTFVIRAERKNPLGGSGTDAEQVEAEQITLTVRAPSEREIEIVAMTYEEEERGEEGESGEPGSGSDSGTSSETEGG